MSYAAATADRGVEHTSPRHGLWGSAPERKMLRAGVPGIRVFKRNLEINGRAVQVALPIRAVRP